MGLVLLGAVTTPRSEGLRGGSVMEPRDRPYEKSGRLGETVSIPVTLQIDQCHH